MTAAAVPASPASAVLAEFRRGSASLAAIAERTGLTLQMVRLVVQRLVALDLLTAEQLSGQCPWDNCGGCAAAAADGSPCSAGGSPGRGPVLIRLSHRAAPARP